MRYEYKKTESTNIIANELAEAGARHGTAVIAEEQTAGRGRRGRKFFSPPGGGIYMSLVLESAKLGSFVARSPALVTVYTAVAVCEAVEAVCGKSLGIKWVNDLFLGGKKVCGISAEAFLDAGRLVVGIGVNLLLPKGLPDELVPIVGAVFGDDENVEEGMRGRLIDEIIARMLGLTYGWDELLHEYKRRVFVIGEVVRVEDAEPYFAHVLDIGEDGGLIVEKEDGERVVLVAGEISILM